MLKKIITLILLFSLSLSNLALAEEAASNVAVEPDFGIGNEIDKREFPEANKVLPDKLPAPDFTIQGGVEKNIDMTLERCIALALGNNPQISAAFQDILASDTRIKQVWSNYFPQVSWQTSYTRIKQLQLSDALAENLTYDYWLSGQVGLQQMLYDFGVTRNQATIRKLDYEAYKTTLVAVINTVIFQTKDSYYNLLYAFERRKVAQDNVIKFEAFYNQAKAFYEIGMNPKVDVTMAETNLSKAKMQLIQADNAISLAVARLNNVMGIPFIDKYNVVERLGYQPIEIDFDSAVNIAREARPELKIAEIKVESARQTIQLVKKSYFPVLMGTAQYMKGGAHPMSNDGYNLGVYLNFPMINGMMINNEVKEARYLYDKELANAKNTQNQIYLEIQNAYLILEEKKHQLPVAILGVKHAKEYYELSYGRYRVGEASPIELQDSQLSYQQAQLKYYEALYQYNSSKAELERVVGKNIVAKAEDIIDFESQIDSEPETKTPESKPADTKPAPDKAPVDKLTPSKAPVGLVPINPPASKLPPPPKATAKPAPSTSNTTNTKTLAAKPQTTSPSNTKPVSNNTTAKTAAKTTAAKTPTPTNKPVQNTTATKPTATKPTAAVNTTAAKPTVTKPTAAKPAAAKPTAKAPNKN